MITLDQFNIYNQDNSTLIYKLLDSFAIEAIHRYSYFSPLTRSVNCNRSRLEYTSQTIQTLIHFRPTLHSY